MRALESPRNDREGPPGPHEGVLGDVVGLVPAHEVRREAPHVGLAGADRVQEGGAVAVACGEEQPRELVHRGRRYWGTSPTPSRLPPYELYADPSRDLGPARRRGPRCRRSHALRAPRRLHRVPGVRPRRRGPPPPACGSRRRPPSPTSRPGSSPPSARNAASAPSADDASTRVCAGSWSPSRVVQIAVAIPALVLGSDAGLPGAHRPPHRLVRRRARGRLPLRGVEAVAHPRPAAGRRRAGRLPGRCRRCSTSPRGTPPRSGRCTT